MYPAKKRAAWPLFAASRANLKTGMGGREYLGVPVICEICSVQCQLQNDEFMKTNKV